MFTSNTSIDTFLQQVRLASKKEKSAAFTPCTASLNLRALALSVGFSLFPFSPLLALFPLSFSLFTLFPHLVSLPLLSPLPTLHLHYLLLTHCALGF